MRLRQSIKPISFLKAHAADVIKELNDTHGTMIITQHGEAKAIIQSGIIEGHRSIREVLRQRLLI